MPIQFKPNIQAVAKKIANYLKKTSFPILSQQALTVILEEWNRESGFVSSGSKISWNSIGRSPNSTRTNPIMTDTGHLQSQISVKYNDTIDNLEVNVSDASYPDRPDRTAADASSFNFHFPHTGIPKEFQLGGNEFDKAEEQGIDEIIELLLKDGFISMT